MCDNNKFKDTALPIPHAGQCQTICTSCLGGSPVTQPLPDCVPPHPKPIPWFTLQVCVAAVDTGVQGTMGTGVCTELPAMPRRWAEGHPL